MIAMSIYQNLEGRMGISMEIGIRDSHDPPNIIAEYQNIKLLGTRGYLWVENRVQFFSGILI